MVKIKECNFKHLDDDFIDDDFKELRCGISLMGNRRDVQNNTCCGEDKCVIYQTYYILALTTNGGW